MSGRFNGKNVCLTAAGFISKTLGEAFIKEGATVYLTSPKLENAERIVSELGPDAVAVQLEMNSSQSRAIFVDRLSEAGGIDVLINHESLIDVVGFLDITEASIDELFAANFRGVTLTFIAVARQMVALGKRGAIVNRLGQLGSTAKDRGTAVTAVFNATNAALSSMTKSAAIALARHGIRVNAIAPGPIALPMWDDLEDAYAKAENRQPGRKVSEMTAAIPMQRFVAPTDLIGTTLFLASDDAAFVTGQIIDVDGGYGLV